MAKFKSKNLKQIVSFDGGFIHFKNGIYETTVKKEIEAIKRALNIEEIGVTKRPPPQQPKKEE